MSFKKLSFSTLFRFKLIYPFLLFTILSVSSLSAQSKKVSGVVKDSSSVSLPGVSIALKGKSTFAVSDAKGNFSINVPENSTLVFSGIGYEPIELKISNKSYYTINLVTKALILDDVVVIGYGSTKRSDVTSSIVKAPIEDMLLAPVKSIDEALQGRVAGVVVSSNDGQPGSAPNITIRGNNSISQNNSPLYVVDGFPLEANSFNDINPADIESIELLKDAAATAIYGARGANGVIMVTTKKGKVGVPVISFNTYTGVQSMNKKMDLMSPYDFIVYQRERDSLSNNFFSLINPNLGYVADSLYLRSQNLEAYKNVKGFDLQDKIFGTTWLRNYDLSIRGGNQQTKYSLSGGIFDQEGIMVNTGFKRHQFRITIDQTVNTRIKWGIIANYANTIQKGQTPTYINTGNPQSSLNIMNAVWSYRPVSPLDANGNQSINLEDEVLDPAIPSTVDFRINPYINQSHIINNNIANNLIVNAYLEYKIIPSLTLRVTAGITSNLNRNEQFYDSSTARGSIRTNFGAQFGVNGSISYIHNNTWINENILTFNKVYNKKHSLNAVGIISQQGNKSYGYGLRSIFVPNQQLGLSGLDEGTPQSVTAISSNWALASFTGRITYDFAKKYFASFSYRADGSSKFSQNNKWAYFPTGSFKWKFSNESFLRGNKILSDGNLRGSYGLTGNNRVNDFSYLAGLNIGYGYQTGYVFNNVIQTSALPSGLANNNLKWETTSQGNIALDLGFFKDRIKLTVEAYRKTTTDLLLNAAIPTSLGYNSAFKNIGSVQNQGLELSISTINIAHKNFTWTTDFNISWNENKVIDLSQNQESITVNVPFDRTYSTLPAYIAKRGQPLGLIFGLVWDGVYQYSDFNNNTVINTSAANAGKGSNWVLKDNVTTNGRARGLIQPGDIKYKDINGDGIINSADYTVIGRGLPIHTGGFNNKFTYKTLDVSLFFQWSYGNEIQNANDILLNGNSNNSAVYSQFAKYNDRWTPDNQSSTTFRTLGSGPTFFSSRTVEDGSYIRLKTVSIGYTFTKKLLKNRLQSCRIYMSAQNLITWTNYSGMDPEISSFNSALTPGFDFSGYPRANTVVGGINITL